MCENPPRSTGGLRLAGPGAMARTTSVLQMRRRTLLAHGGKGAIIDESVTDMKVRIYGNVAIVNGRVIEKVKAKEKEGQIQYRRTTV